MSLLAPDIAGFNTAQGKLYDFFGVACNFGVPIQTEWDVTVPMDPFGQPLDAFAAPASGGVDAYNFTAVTAIIVNRPFGGRGQVKDTTTGLTPVGRIGDAEIGLHIRPADYALIGRDGTNGEATIVEVGGVRYDIRDWRPGGLPQTGYPTRYEVFLREEGMA
jgi:hypothetical protein